MRVPTLHRSSLVVLVAGAILLILVNVPGELTSPLNAFVGGGPSLGTPDYRAEYEHGWPWVFLYRAIDYRVPRPASPNPASTALLVRMATSPFEQTWGIPWLSWRS